MPHACAVSSCIRCLLCIAASAGVSVAKVYKLETPNVVIEKKQGDAEAEIKKFDEALEKTKKDIEGVKERAAKRLSEEELAVFDAHLMMAGDPELAGHRNYTITCPKRAATA